MISSNTVEESRVATASCTCGNLKLRVRGEPTAVYICSCQACQRTTGSAFAYRAQFRTVNVLSIEGQQGHWRRLGDSGRWVEHVFCPSCGALVFMNAESLQDAIAVSAGCFADTAFPKPTRQHFASSSPLWLVPPSGALVVS